MPNALARTRCILKKLLNFRIKNKEANLYTHLEHSEHRRHINSTYNIEMTCIMSEYGENGKQYVQWCAQLAESYKIGVPWVMCQQSDAPDPIVIKIKNFVTIRLNIII